MDAGSGRRRAWVSGRVTLLPGVRSARPSVQRASGSSRLIARTGGNQRRHFAFRHEAYFAHTLAHCTFFAPLSASPILVTPTLWRQDGLRRCSWWWDCRAAAPRPAGGTRGKERGGLARIGSRPGRSVRGHWWHSARSGARCCPTNHADNKKPPPVLVAVVCESV